MLQRVIPAFPFKSIQPSLPQNYHSIHSKSIISWITAFSTFSHKEAFSPEPNAKISVLSDYLVCSLNFSKDKAYSVSSKFSHCKILEKPEQVVHFFRSLGFTDAHIRSMTHSVPQILFSDVEKTLKPKVIFFLELGLSEPDLGPFISRAPSLLTCSLDRTLKPIIYLIRNAFASDGRNRSIEMVNDDLVRTITRCSRIVLARRLLEANIQYLKSCGVDASQLSSLLLRLPRIFTLQQEKLAEIVSRALDMKFTMGSRMLVHAIHCLSGMSMETFNGKFEVFGEFGFSKEETVTIFRKSPYVFGLSVAKLRCKLELLLNNLKISRLVVVQNPGVLSLNIEERVIPRYKVLEILKSRGLLRKEPCLSKVMYLAESKFLEGFVLPFESEAEELLLAYKGQSLKKGRSNIQILWCKS